MGIRTICGLCDSFHNTYHKDIFLMHFAMSKIKSFLSKLIIITDSDNNDTNTNTL